MEGAAWTLGKEQPMGELSCRALPAFTEHGPPPPPSVTGPSPYATTALLDTAHQSTGQLSYHYSWLVGTVGPHQHWSVETPLTRALASWDTVQQSTGQFGHRSPEHRSVGSLDSYQ